jgi:hypothetical protein
VSAGQEWLSLGSICLQYTSLVAVQNFTSHQSLRNAIVCDFQLIHSLALFNVNFTLSIRLLYKESRCLRLFLKVVSQK